MGYNGGVIVYAAKSILSIATSFFSHWYGGGIRVAIFGLGGVLRTIDEVLVIREALRDAFFFNSKIGIIGNARKFLGGVSVVIAAGLLYIFLTVTFLAFYFLWAAIPFYLAYKIFNPK